MKILLCHNYYQQRGGEDESFAAEAALLQSHGHDVLTYTLHNDSIRQSSRIATAARTFWNRQTYRQLRELIGKQRPDVMHCTNTFPLISPAAYYAARAERVPVVQSLRNYRLLCANSYFLRENRVCEDCLGRWTPWPAVLHGCYRGSRAASAVVGGMLVFHRVLRTWQRAVDRYFTPSEFTRQKFIAAGMPGQRIVVKPNFVHPDPGAGPGGGYAIFVGRLSPEKGLETLLSAWEQLAGRVPLKIVGDGPLGDLARDVARRLPGVEWLGRQRVEDVLALLGGAAVLLMPSIWYETFGRTVIEAYAKGTPVIASRMGSMAELVDHGRTGLLFTPGDARELADAVLQIVSNPAGISRMRQAAREEYQRKYTAESNYQMLMSIYSDAAAQCAGRRQPIPAIRGGTSDG
jgi:glycosyltransferase involved in cell wall biosynthesis